MVVLTTDRKLFIVGEGGNGQLGLDLQKTKKWEPVLLPLKDGQQIAGVHAGYKTTFLLVENTIA